MSGLRGALGAAGLGLGGLGQIALSQEALSQEALGQAAQEARARGEPGIVVCITAHRGSVPRETGTRMLVLPQRVLGTLGGGHLELQAIERARDWLAGAGGMGALGASHPHPNLLPLRGRGSEDAEPSARAEPVEARKPSVRAEPVEAPASATSARAEPVEALVPTTSARAEPVEALPPAPTSLPFTQSVALGPSLGQCCGGALTLRYSRLADDDPAAWVLPPPRFVLHLFGAGHVGRAIVQVLAGVPCRVHWIDEREAEFPRGALPPQVRRVCTEPAEAEVAAAAPGDFFLVLTHSHALDLRITQAILARGDFGFAGLIGSATKRARFERRLAERGIAAERLARLHCPIGLPGLRGKEPGVIAVSAVAQLLAHSG